MIFLGFCRTDKHSTRPTAPRTTLGSGKRRDDSDSSEEEDLEQEEFYETIVSQIYSFQTGNFRTYISQKFHFSEWSKLETFRISETSGSQVKWNERLALKLLLKARWNFKLVINEGLQVQLYMCNLTSV